MCGRDFAVPARSSATRFFISSAALFVKVTARIFSGENVSPENILAVTFTNKAAEEMKKRVAELLAGTAKSLPHIGTFHAICSRLLRREINKLGYSQSFSILD